MGISYAKSYLKIYIWQGIAFVLRFLSMFIVTPYLSKEPSTYGIYAVCISVTIFLNYADMGFLSAGQKFASECYARAERSEEMKYIGFGIFILLIFALICALIFFYFGLHPQALIKGLDTSEKISTATNLLLILAVFTPVAVLQRMIAMVFDIRLDNYINQRISLFASILTIASVFYFFRNGNYQIVSYFLFSQSINLAVVIICFFLAKRKYNYNIKRLFYCVRFDPIIYKRAKQLAYSGLYGMIVWLLFYEIDQIIIAKFLGSNKVAIYAIAIAFPTVFRTVLGIIFGPFLVRANYFVGIGDDEGLKKFCIQLVSLSAPVIVISTVAISIVSQPLVLSWVGNDYTESVNLAKLLVLVFTLSFISSPLSLYLVAKERLKEVYFIATILPFLYWGGILFSYSTLGLLSFGLFKLIATIVTSLFYLHFLVKYFKLSLLDFLRRVIVPLILPLCFLVSSLLIANRFLPNEKSKMNLLLVIGTAGLSIILSLLIAYFTSSRLRINAKNILGNIFLKTLNNE
jgi:O-antigen/teichoic acid export membrane protein